MRGTKQKRGGGKSIFDPTVDARIGLCQIRPLDFGTDFATYAYEGVFSAPLNGCCILDFRIIPPPLPRNVFVDSSTTSAIAVRKPMGAALTVYRYCRRWSIACLLGLCSAVHERRNYAMRPCRYQSLDGSEGEGEGGVVQLAKYRRAQG